MSLIFVADHGHNLLKLTVLGKMSPVIECYTILLCLALNFDP